ncbi:MAG: hypothetical protein WCW13_01535 [archaeon]
MKDYNVIASLRRSKIKPHLLELLSEPKTVTDLKKLTTLHRESISRALIDLEKQGLVKCLNPEQPNFRYYSLTKKGKALDKAICLKPRVS